MSEKKRPILTVLAVLGLTVLFLGAIMAVVIVVFGPNFKISLGDKIGVIPIEGPILNSDPIVSQLVDFKKDKRIKAIILRIDSPGGGVGPSQEIYREIEKTIKTKKVVASMGGLAASGGYYIAAAANKIVANEGTITGSIGVIMQFVQLQDLLQKIGISMEVIKSGEFKDTGSPHRKMSQRDRELLQGLISEVQNQFVEAVARGRNLSVEKVREIADGRILTGAKAKELGLVDLLGNFRDAVDLAKKLTGIKGDVVLVYPKKDKFKIWDIILRDMARAVYEAVVDSLETRLGYRYRGLSYLLP